jgi:site-specific recombinase XerD
MTPQEWINAYEEHLRLVKNASENTIRGYISDLTQLCQTTAPEDWALFTEDVTTRYVADLRIKMRTTSVARKVYCFKGFFKFLQRRKVVTDNPFEEIQFNRLLRKLPNVLTVGEMTRLLNSIRQPIAALLGIPNEEAFLTIRDKAMLETFFSSALRVSELVGLNWQDVEWKARQVRVVGKGNKMRLAPLGQPAIDSMIEYAKTYEQHWHKKPQGTEPVFLSMWNRRIETRSIPRTIKKWAKRAGIDKRVNPHCFRHSAAVAMLEAGADLRAIQQMLGHASIATTELYVRVSTRRLKVIHAQTHPRA